MSDTPQNSSQTSSGPRVGVRRPGVPSIPMISPETAPRKVMAIDVHPDTKVGPAPSSPDGYFPPLKPGDPPRRPQQVVRSSDHPTRKPMRAEHGIMPETWAEYVLWQGTKRMDGRHRRLQIAFNQVDDHYALSDELSDAIHSATATCSSVVRVVNESTPGALLGDQHRELLAERLGFALFSLVTVQAMLSENWGYGQSISGRHFASTDDLTSVAKTHDMAASTVGAPTEVVSAWHLAALKTAVGMMSIVGWLSGEYWLVRWGGKEGLDVEAAAAQFKDALECFEVLATLLGLTLQECLAANLHKVNSIYPEGWKPPE